MISGISHALFLLPVPTRHQAGPCTLNTLNMVTQRNVNLSVTFAACTSEHLPRQNHTSGKYMDIWMKCNHDHYITRHMQ